MSSTLLRHLSLCVRTGLVSIFVLLAACGSSDSGDTPPAEVPGFALTLESPALNAPQGSDVFLRLSIQRVTGFVAPVEISLASPPAGVSLNGITLTEASSGRMTLSVAPDVPAGELSLTVQAAGGGLTRTTPLKLTVGAAQPSSQALIVKALSENRIDLGTALLYRAYAAYADARLPVEFAGSGSEEEDNGLIGDISDNLASLSPTIQAQLLPYTFRPSDPRSFVSLQLAALNSAAPTSSTTRDRAQAVEGVGFAEKCTEGKAEWINKRATNPVRVWVVCFGDRRNAASESDLLRMLDMIDKIYGSMTAFMGAPIADESLGVGSVSPDTAIDIYVLPTTVDLLRPVPGFDVQGVRGVAMYAAPFGGTTSSGYIHMPEWRVREPDFGLTLIHEFFHVLQFKTNYQTRFWFTEASATWASVHFNRTIPVDPSYNINLHVQRFVWLFQSPTDGLLDKKVSADYGAYVWPLFMEQRAGAGAVAEAWKLLEGVTTDVGANNVLNFLLPFDSNFRRFAVRNINLKFLPGDPLPKDERYVGIDRFFPDGFVVPALDEYRKLGIVAAGISATTDQLLSLGKDLPALSAGYYELEVAPDPAIKQVVFDLEPALIDGLDIDALVKINGSWEAAPRDLNGTRELRFCLDKPDQKLERIWFVFSNHQRVAGQTINVSFRVKGLRAACKSQLRGNSSGTLEGGPLGRYEYDARDVVMEQDEDLSVFNTAVYRPVSGSVSFRWIIPGCTVDVVPSTYLIKPNDFDGTTGTTGGFTIDYNTNPPTAGGVAATSWYARATIACPGEETSTLENVLVGIGGWLASPDGKNAEVKDNGTLVRDAFTQGDQSFNYEFRVVP